MLAKGYTMKLLALTPFLFSSLLCSAQPDYPEPCSSYSELFDLNNDAGVDMYLYIGSEGTDDVPSSSGTCMYKLSMVNLEVLSKEESYFPEVNAGSIIKTEEFGEYTHSTKFFSQLLSMGYGQSATGEWRSQYKAGLHYFFIRFQVENEAEQHGWLGIEILPEDGIVKITHRLMEGNVTIGE